MGLVWVAGGGSLFSSLLPMTAFGAHPVVKMEPHFMPRLSPNSIIIIIDLHLLPALASPFSLFFSPCSLFRMGRVKLKIKRLEHTNGRQATYAKRKHGIMKKASELSILCDIDIILLMFSPTGKPSLCSGQRSSIEEVIAKFAQLTPQERAKRKLEGLEALKKTFKKLDHDVNIQEFLDSSTQTVEDLNHQCRSLETQLSETHRRLSLWNNLDKINNLEQLLQMENSIKESLGQIQEHKDYLGKQLVSIESANQFQNVMHAPFRMTAEQHLQNISWIPNNDNGQMTLPDDSNLLPPRDLECSASSSFGSYSSYFGSGKSSEISNSGLESGIPGDLTGSAPVTLQLASQLPYLPYDISFMNGSKFQSLMELNFQGNPLECHVNGNSEASQAEYDTTPGSWASTSGPCGVTLYDEPLYSRQLS